MDIRRIPFGHLYIPGILMVLLGFTIIALTVHELVTDAHANRTTAGLASFLGALSFTAGIVLCMGSCMLKDAQADFASRAQRARSAISLSTNDGGGSKSKSRGSHSSDTELSLSGSIGAAD